MNLSTPFIRRPVATILLTFGMMMAGLVAFPLLPVAPLPAVDYPVISVRASLPGASPEVVANTVASPLERRLGAIADVNEMTSSSSVGGARITLQFAPAIDVVTSPHFSMLRRRLTIVVGTDGKSRRLTGSEAGNVTLDV